MSHALTHILERLNKQNDTLGISRNAYLAKEAERKHFEATLIREAKGKSHAESVIIAQATGEWLEFAVALARLEAEYEFQRLKFDVLDKEYMALYLEAKLNATLIGKHGRSA